MPNVSNYDALRDKYTHPKYMKYLLTNTHKRYDTLKSSLNKIQISLQNF